MSDADPEATIADHETKVTIANGGSSVRWQGITIAQLGFASNLIFGLSVAALGFETTFLLNGNFHPDSFLPKMGFLLSLFTFPASIGLGIWLVLNRLEDFRATAMAARLREDKRPLAEIAPYRALYRKCGTRTWWLFRWQVGTFALGIVLLFLSVVLPAASKMFC